MKFRIVSMSLASVNSFTSEWVSGRQIYSDLGVSVGRSLWFPSVCVCHILFLRTSDRNTQALTTWPLKHSDFNFPCTDQQQGTAQTDGNEHFGKHCPTKTFPLCCDMTLGRQSHVPALQDVYTISLRFTFVQTILLSRTRSPFRSLSQGIITLKV